MNSKSQAILCASIAKTEAARRFGTSFWRRPQLPMRNRMLPQRQPIHSRHKARPRRRPVTLLPAIIPRRAVWQALPQPLTRLSLRIMVVPELRYRHQQQQRTPQPHRTPRHLLLRRLVRLTQAAIQVRPRSRIGKLLARLLPQRSPLKHKHLSRKPLPRKLLSRKFLTREPLQRKLLSRKRR
jgi:hypothetical protein